MMWWNHGAWGAGDWLSMSVMMLAFWALVIALILWLVRSSRNGSEDRLTVSPMQRADEVLAERFAGGEIDEEEFTRRRASLHTDHHPFVSTPRRR
jgi:putative membrane protein